MNTPTPCPRCGAPLASGGALDALCPTCLLAGAPAPPIHSNRPLPKLDELAEIFPDLELLGVIGRGGCGVVYKARQRRLDRLVALKLLDEEYSSDEDFAARFLREARTLARLDHPSIVRVHDFGEREGRHFLLMEYVDGVSLRERLEARDLEPSEVLELASQVCEGLQYAHAQGVVHRDIKPENLLLSAEGHLKIADFGLAKIVELEGPALTRATQVMGTLHYMAPEQVNRPLEVDHRADIYSLGVVLYEMLTAQLPIGRFRPPSELARDKAAYDPLVLKALELEPRERYQQARELREELARIEAVAASLAARARAAVDAGVEDAGAEAVASTPDVGFEPARGDLGSSAASPRPAERSSEAGEHAHDQDRGPAGASPADADADAREGAASERTSLRPAHSRELEPDGERSFGAWLDALRVPPAAVAAASLVIAWAWLWFLGIPPIEWSEGGRWTSTGRLMNGHLPDEWIASAYPLVFLCLWIALERSPGGRLGSLLRSLGFVNAAAVLARTALNGSGDVRSLVIEALAAIAVVLAHLSLERWLRVARFAPFAGAVALMVVATLMHSALATHPGREAYYHASGMTAIVALASLLPLLPSALRGEGAPTRAFLRVLSIGLVAAAFYFHRQLF